MTSERAGTRERILVLLRRHGRLSAPGWPSCSS